MSVTYFPQFHINICIFLQVNKNNLPHKTFISLYFYELIKIVKDCNKKNTHVCLSYHVSFYYCLVWTTGD